MKMKRRTRRARAPVMRQSETPWCLTTVSRAQSFTLRTSWRRRPQLLLFLPKLKRPPGLVLSPRRRQSGGIWVKMGQCPYSLTRRQPLHPDLIHPPNSPRPSVKFPTSRPLRRRWVPVLQHQRKASLRASYGVGSRTTWMHCWTVSAFSASTNLRCIFDHFGLI